MEAELKLLDSFAGKRVLVVGDGCTDVDIEVEPRNNPEGDWPCWIEGLVDARGGMADAVASMAESLGAVVARFIEDRYTVRRYWHDGQCVARFDHLRRMHSIPCCGVSGKDAVIISDYGKGSLTDRNTREIIAAAKAANVPVLVDPARGVPWSRYAGATIIKCNDEEAERQPLDVADAIVVTKGPHGMTMHRGTEFAQHFATEPRDGDVCGCGDMVAAVLGLTLASRGDLATGCKLSNVAAWCKLGHRGAQPVSADEVRAAIGVVDGFARFR